MRIGCTRHLPLYILAFTPTRAVKSAGPAFAAASTPAFKLIQSVKPIGSRLPLLINTRGGRSMSSTAAASASADVLSSAGEFKRVETVWRSWIGEDTGFPAESGRYHLYVAYACPWAHRTLMMRALKGLEDAISVTVVHPVWQQTRPGVDDHAGWIFADPSAGSFTNWKGIGGPFPASYPGCDPDPIMGAKTVRDIYDAAGTTGGRYSVPILFDKKTKTIVNNESAEIIRMLNQSFNSFAKNPDLDLYPEDIRSDIDEVNNWVFSTINNGVYRCGFGTTQAAYDEAIESLTNAFDRVDQILQKQRFLCGDRFTEADLRLFVTLVRFDEVYVVYFKTNTRSVTHTPSILNYCREIYQMPGVKETVSMDQIKTHYYSSHPLLNHYSIIPRGSDFIALLEQPHNRDKMDEAGTTNGTKKPRIDEQ